MNIAISVCLASYNGSPYLADQIDSILCQLSDKDELLVADDGSSDGTLAILEQYGSQLKIVQRSRIGNIVLNFERVLSSARGEVIVLSDQDDIWLPGRLERIRLEMMSADLLLLNAKIVDKHLNYSGNDLFSINGVRKGFLDNFLKNSFVGCCMAFKRDILALALPFPRKLPWHDWYIGLIGEMFFTVMRIDEPYLLYRRHGNNFSETGQKSSNSILTKLLIRVYVFYAVCISILRKVRSL